MDEWSTKPTAVRNLQRYLRRLSFEDNDIPPIPVDGIFASETEAAVEEFQRMSGLPVTGIADRITWELLFAEYSRLQKESDARNSPDFFPKTPSRYQTSVGESGAFILLLQWMISELSASYDSLSPPEITGIMDEDTMASVLEFQRILGLPQTGRVDRNTWNHLSREYDQLIF